MSSNKDIETTITSVLKNIDEDNAQAYQRLELDPAIQKAFAAAQFGNYDEFYFELQYPFEQVISGLLTNVTKNHTAQHILKHSQFIEQHLNDLFERYEGATCCVDKARTMIKKTLAFHMHGTRIEFDYDQEFTYHLPKKIFTNHDDIIEFIGGLLDLYYGKPKRYLLALKGVIIRA